MELPVLPMRWHRLNICESKMKKEIEDNIVKVIKRLFGIDNLSLWVRKRQQDLESVFYHKKYTAKELVNKLVELGMKPGSTVVVHCAMNNFYNYHGTVNELIDEMQAALGPEGTLCMPAYPKDKNNTNMVFDVRNTPTAAGILAETFRKRPGVKRSLNQLHSVCAYGPHADEIVSEHHLSRTCFDEKSPYYKIAMLGGLTISLGLPKYFIGTIEHVPDSLLMDEIPFYSNKFTRPVTFTYIDERGKEIKHTMLSCSSVPYVLSHKTKLVDKYFDKQRYSRTRFSNIWINMFDARYLVDKLQDLGRQGKTIYSYPTFI